MHNIGIYTIYCSSNNKYYIGYSKNLSKRLGQHKLRLKKGIHENIFLQNAYNKYGVSTFEFEILENCEESYLCSQEHYWCNMLNTHDKNYGYNILPTHPNIRNSGHSLETIIKMKNAAKICKHRENRRKKIIIYNLNGEFIEIVNSILEAANKLNTNTGNIVRGLKSKSKCVSNHLIDLYDKNTKMSIKSYTKNTGHQVFLRVIVNNEEKFYKSFREASKYLVINRSYITKYLNTNLAYEGSLKYKTIFFFSLTKEEYQKAIKNENKE